MSFDPVTLAGGTLLSAACGRNVNLDGSHTHGLCTGTMTVMLAKWLRLEREAEGVVEPVTPTCECACHSRQRIAKHP